MKLAIDRCLETMGLLSGEGGKSADAEIVRKAAKQYFLTGSLPERAKGDKYGGLWAFPPQYHFVVSIPFVIRLSVSPSPPHKKPRSLCPFFHPRRSRLHSKAEHPTGVGYLLLLQLELIPHEHVFLLVFER